MTYPYTKNILLVKKLLEHGKIENTMKYTQLVHFEDDEFEVATATTIEEAKKLLEVVSTMSPRRTELYSSESPKDLGVLMRKVGIFSIMGKRFQVFYTEAYFFPTEGIMCPTKSWASSIGLRLILGFVRAVFHVF